MDAFLGVFGALLGVALGGWLSTRGEAKLLQEAHQEADRQFRANAYIEYLTVHRRFRRFLLTETVQVKLVRHVGRGNGNTPVIDDSTAHWEAVERARSTLEIWPSANNLMPRAGDVTAALYDVARARASCAPGEVPMPIVDVARKAEHEFAQAARVDLERA